MILKIPNGWKLTTWLRLALWAHQSKETPLLLNFSSRLFSYSNYLLLVMGFFDNYYLFTWANCTVETWSYTLSPWFWPIAWLLLGSVFFLSLMGLVLNSLSLTVLSRACDDSLMGLILKHTAVCDQFVLLLNSWDSVCHTFESFTSLTPPFRFALAYTHPFCWHLLVVFISVRNWSMTLLSVTRCCQIASPFRFGPFFTRKFVKSFFACLWLVTLALNCLKFAEVSAILANCEEGTKLHIKGAKVLPEAYIFTTSITFNSIIPLVCTVLANVVLIVELRRSADFRESANAGPKSAQGTGRLVTMLSSMFVICQLPTLANAWAVSSIKDPALYVIVTQACVVVNNIDSSCNFFIYIFTNPKFNQEIEKLLWKKTSAENNTTMASLNEP